MSVILNGGRGALNAPPPLPGILVGYLIKLFSDQPIKKALRHSTKLVIYLKNKCNLSAENSKIKISMSEYYYLFDQGNNFCRENTPPTYLGKVTKQFLLSIYGF